MEHSSGIPAVNEPRLQIDPELAVALDAIPKGPRGVYDLTDLESTRAQIPGFVAAVEQNTPDVPPSTVDEHAVPRPDGTDLAVRVVRPAGRDEVLPAVLWFHGGGQVLGYAAQDDLYLKQLCAEIGCAAVSVDYRLAPETRAPGAAEDGYLAYGWLLDHGAAIGLDTARIGLAGASGGGGIAIASALMIRDRGLASPLFQTFHYPMIDDRNVTLSSQEITDVGVWDRATNELAWRYILGDQAGGPDVPAYCAPARAEDLTGLAPTFIAVAELDCFRDEDIQFAHRLRDAGVPVELHLFPNAYHAWALFAPESSLGRVFTQVWHASVSRFVARR